MKQFYFERLEVWQKGRVFIWSIYLLSNKFPSEEKFGMIQQIRRAYTSATAILQKEQAGILVKTRPDSLKLPTEA